MKTLRHAADGAAPARTRTFFPRLTVLLAALAFAAFAASALAGSFAVNGSFRFDSSITNADPVVMNPGFGGSPSGCGTAPPPVSTEAGNYHYKVYSFRNISQKIQCINVSLTVSSGLANAIGYRGSFAPGNPSANFAGDTLQPGLSGGQANGFGFDVTCDSCTSGPPTPGPETFDVVVREETANAGAIYTLLVEGTGVILTGGGPTANPTALQSFRASAARTGVLVRWRTRSEADALGYNLYRGAAKKVRLTRSLVRASGNGSGHSYSYLDRSARKSKAPYYLEIVQRGGSRIMFGPARTVAG